MSQYKKKKVAIKGLGKMTTDPDGYIKFEEDITVPCGPLIPGKEDSPLDFNEFCVYDSMQVSSIILLLKFILHVVVAILYFLWIHVMQKQRSLLTLFSSFLFTDSLGWSQLCL